MNLRTSYLVAVCPLLLGIYSCNRGPQTEPAQLGEWFRIEALDLQLSGPCYDVAFFQDAILYLKPGVETIYQLPLETPNPAESRPLFANRDISCSPAALTFSSDYQSGYCTRAVMGHEQQYSEQIFEFSLEEDRISAYSEAAFSDDVYRSLHPALSMDGSLLVFSSDRPPTQGGLDLFVTHRTANGWSDPVNLGDAINTSGHEWFPFLDVMNNLWFSSTGHTGYGGFDIFVCTYDGTSWGFPKNLGESINGSQNELGFSLHPIKQLALFSRSMPDDSSGVALMVSLNQEALDTAGIDNPSARNLARLLQHMADPVSPVTASQALEPESTQVSRQPQKPESTQVSQQPQEPKSTGESLQNRESRPAPEPIRPYVTESTSSASTVSDSVVFRVQIISSLYENSFPTVIIEGQTYSTYQYFYLGSYRITVGKFSTLKEANEFKVKCLNSGFKQAFVAAFRGDKRVTDPEVYKQ